MKLGDNAVLSFVSTRQGIWAVDNQVTSTSSFIICPKLTALQCESTSLLSTFIDQTILEGMGRERFLDWDASFCTFLPFKTLSDHNCLCHGISISLWGSQDKDYTLRNAIEQNLAGDGVVAHFFKEQWRKALVDRDHQAFGAEVERSSEEWAREWAEELSLVKDSNHSLTEIHIFVLSHVVRRPIIVYSSSHLKDVHGKDLAPIYFGGIYLPLLLEEEECSSKCPVLLAYSGSHFTALIPLEMEDDDYLVVPLVQADGQHLPIQFIDQKEFPAGGAGWKALLGQYLVLVEDEGHPCIGAQLICSLRSPFAAELYEHCAAVQEQGAEEDADMEAHNVLNASQSEGSGHSWQSRRSLSSSPDFSGSYSPKPLKEEPTSPHPLLGTCAATQARRHSEQLKPFSSPSCHPHPLRCESPASLPPRSATTSATGLGGTFGTNSPTAPPVVSGGRWPRAKPPEGPPPNSLLSKLRGAQSPCNVVVTSSSLCPWAERFSHSPAGGIRPFSPANAPPSSPLFPARSPSPSMRSRLRIPSSPTIRTPTSLSPALRVGTLPAEGETSPVLRPKSPSRLVLRPAPVAGGRPHDMRRATITQMQGVVSPRLPDSPLMPPRATSDVLDGLRAACHSSWSPATAGAMRTVQDACQRLLPAYSTEVSPPPPPYPGKPAGPPPGPRQSIDAGRMRFLEPVAL